MKLEPTLATFSFNRCSYDFFYKGRDDIEEKQSKYLNEARMAFVQNYLENTEDTRSLTTGTSDDDGIGSHSTLSTGGAKR